MTKQNKLTPELHFPEFTKSAAWEVKALEEICDVYRGSTFSKADIDEKGSVFCIHYGELFTKYNEVISSVSSRTNKEDGFKSKVGDILMPSSDVTPDGLAKASAIMIDDVVLGGDMNILRQKGNSNSIFLSYLLNHSKSEIIKLVSGTTVKHIYPSQIITCQLPIAKVKSEQQKIASCLSSLDEVITAHSHKLELLKDHKKGLMQDLFPQEGEKVPKLRFMEFEGEWVEKTLETLTLKISDGIHTTPVYDVNGDYYFINGNNLVDGRILIDEKTKRVSEDEYEKHKKELDGNTILLSINGTIGNISVYNNEKVILGKSACYININETKTNKDFIIHFLQSEKVKQYFNSELTGSTIKNLSLKSIKETIVQIPINPKEQQKIASCLSALDKLITAQAEKIEQLKQHKKGLMQGLFPKMND